jgi:hypothetical protein
MNAFMHPTRPTIRYERRADILTAFLRLAFELICPQAATAVKPGLITS